MHARDELRDQRDGTVDGADDGTLKGPVDWSGNGVGLDATSVRIIDGRLDELIDPLVAHFQAEKLKMELAKA